MKTTSRPKSKLAGLKPSLTTKTKKFVAKMMNKKARFDAKTAARISKNKLRTEKLGILGDIARRQEVRKQAAQAKIEIEKVKPKVFEHAKKTQIETEASVKRTKARGAAASAVASALGSAYAYGKARSSAVEEAKAKAEEAEAKILAATIGANGGVADVNTTYNQPSAAGLVTGVR